MTEGEDAVTYESIARDLLEYLRENPAACANVSIAAGNHPWFRYRDGEWQRAQIHRHGRVKSEVLDQEDVVRLFTTNPVNLRPTTDAYRWGPSDRTIWEHAAEQDAFTDRDRCWYCGQSERTRDVQRYETTEDGKILLCSDCHETWEKAGEIVRPVQGGSHEQ